MGGGLGGVGLGGGGGRVLRGRFERVELVEQCRAFVERAAEEMPEVKGVCQGLQEWRPEEGAYDVLWVQWVTGHLRDEDFGPFLERMAKGLAERGALVIKDNTAAGEQFVMDCTDHSLTRTLKHYKAIFKAAKASTGLELVECILQEGFPEGVFPVYSFVLCRAK